MILDEVEITLSAGAGGNGCVSYRREKFIPRGGPDGGNGGLGGNAYIIGVSDLTALNFFRGKKNISAQNGGPGRSKKRAGAAGDDLILRVPIGTKVRDIKRGDEAEIIQVGQKILVAKGGRGGVGNFKLRTATNKTPDYAEPGRPGQSRQIHLNLQFIADIGLLGLPNAGKSSLLNVLTKADVKVADYPFTTLEANLGEMNGKIIADIPGLIEGASSGRGLGIKFLKHIKKTKLLAHCIDITSNDIKKDYQTIREELAAFSQTLLQKKELIILTKSDLLEKKEVEQKLSKTKKINSQTFTVSILENADILKIKKILLQEI